MPGPEVRVWGTAAAAMCTGGGNRKQVEALVANASAEDIQAVAAAHDRRVQQRHNDSDRNGVSSTCARCFPCEQV